MPHILVAGHIHDAGIARLEAAPGVTYRMIKEITRESYEPFIAEADALVIRTQPLPADVIAKANKLQIVSRHGVGYDAVDVPALNARGIPLAIIGDVNSRAVAEHALMLMLAAGRRTIAHDAATREGRWNERNRFDTMELDGRRLLVLGFGRIGRRVAELARAFGMTVSAYDPFVPPDAMAAVGVASEASIADALPRADFVTLHLPLSPEGAVIGADELRLMKPSAILVNAARGGLVDEMALDRALREGRLLAAGLDVLLQEPPPADHPLLTNARVTFSPHSAGLTAGCAARMAEASIDNVLDFYAGRLPASLVVNAADIGFDAVSSAR